MNRNIRTFFLVIIGVVIFFAQVAAAGSYKPEYKLSVVVGPQGPWGESAVRFSDLVRERTNGRIRIEVYFSGKLLGGRQTHEFDILNQGGADFALGSTINWSTQVKELNLFSLPFLFPSYKALDAVENGEPGQNIFNLLEARGVVGLGWGENGFRDLTNAKHPVTNPEDLSDLKIRVVGSPIFIDTFRALGADPVSLNWAEALPAFRNGTVDGQENPIDSVVIPYKLWEFHQYITIWKYAVDPLILGVNKSVWMTFDPKDRGIIREAAREAMAWNKKGARRGLDGSTDAIDLLKRSGMSVVSLTAGETEAFKIRTRPVYDKWAGEIGSDLVLTTEKIIQAVR